MLQFIHNDFKLDLSHLKVTFVSENIWFKKEINSDYSFPFIIPFDEWAKISNSAHYNSLNGVIKFSGRLYRDGMISTATLKVEDVQGKFVSAVIYSGLENLTCFDKKLSDLELDNFTVADIRTHALTIITQDYPAVNYNFPMIHTDKYKEIEGFSSFENVLNKIKEGLYVENTVDSATNLDLVRNIMQPLPYLMHVVKKGFESDGYDLQGDILSIDEFNKTLIFRDGNYYEETKKEVIPFQIEISQHVSSEGFFFVNFALDAEVVNFFKEVIIEKKGTYNLFGDIKSFQYKRFKHPVPFLYMTPLSYKLTKISAGTSTTILIYNQEIDTDLTGANLGYYSVSPNASIDLNVDFEAGDVLRFEKQEARRDLTPVILEDYPYVIDMSIIPVRYKNSDNTPILSILDRNEINLTQVVPDMTFGDLIAQLMILKKLDLRLEGNIIYMNYVQTQLDRSNAINVSNNDIEEPIIKYNDERSYELSFSDGKSHDLYKYDSVFIDINGSIINDYIIKKDTTPIKIDLLPYPVVQRGDIKTALAFDQETSKLRVVFFNSVDDQDDNLYVYPVCHELSNMLIPGIYTRNYKDWLFFLINSRTFEWNFIISVEKFRSITAQSLIYAYNNFHVFTELEQERMNHLYWRVTAKTESLI
ncbi:hypothetical protein LXD69_07375 [Flavobacterium sediminilitoris]|uniref:Uncharacterized protein n=1 Tax=Flavobacterium sediminilitoris TaxID=2024526 RepID=A0ABY4HT34_9FLAO|nr:MULTISPECIES: hypothetical protein [Flavobacterium]UOX35332.1 hypothetical protein LXD69_07375 [Flavobacterium sediminilitoris]